MQMHLSYWQVILLCAVALTIFIRVYGKMLLHIQDRGGAVKARVLQLPDTMIAMVLMFYFVTLIIGMMGKTESGNTPIPADGQTINVLEGSLTMAVLPLGVILFMIYRQVPVAKLLGLRSMGVVRVLINALALLLAAIPAIFLTGSVTQQLLGENAVPQMLVELYKSAKEKGDFKTLWQIAVSAVLIAPVVEELLFRGFFYPALKRHIGGVHSAWITSLLFGGIHGNLLSFPGLVVLAFALTIAFERTGSILVSIAMHAGFNALSLLAMWQMLNSTP